MPALLIGLILLLLPVATAAQTATPNSRLGWTQDAPTLAVAQAYVYEAIFDDGAPTPLTGVTCGTGAAPTEFSCAAAWPALTPATHRVALRAVRVDGSQRLESPLSAVFAFTFVALPAAPRNLRIVSVG